MVAHPPCTDSSEAKVALVLAGGGALGAFEAGVLRYALDGLAAEIGRPPRVSIFSGTSVGALNACYLAANAGDLPRAARHLAHYWEHLTFDKVLRFGNEEVGALVRLLLGFKLPRTSRRHPRPLAYRAPHPPVAGLFDTTPLRQEMKELISWAKLQDNIQRTVVQGVALCATEVCTGTSTIFYQTSAGTHYQPGRDPLKEAKFVQLQLDHVMASAAIPFLFPAVQINGVCYTDGALRQNTPLNPAMRMGANRLLVISLTQDPRLASRTARIGCRKNPYPGALFLLGRTVNVLLTQTLDYELNRVEMYNKILDGGCQAYGPSFLQEFNHIIGGYRNASYRHIQTCHVRPAQDLQQLALHALKEAPHELRLPGLPGRLLSRLFSSSAMMEAEILALLMFTPTFIKMLVELGDQQARAHKDQLAAIFYQ